MRRNLYIFILAALFLGAARILHSINFWGLIGLPSPHGFEIQGLLFLGTLFVLQNFLFDPYIQVLEQREDKTTHQKERAEKTRQDAEKMIEKYKKSISDVRIRATLERERIALEAEAKEKETILAAKKEGNQRIVETTAKIETDSERVKKDLSTQVDAIAGEIVQRISAVSGSIKNHEGIRHDLGAR